MSLGHFRLNLAWRWDQRNHPGPFVPPSFSFWGRHVGQVKGPLETIQTNLSLCSRGKGGPEEAGLPEVARRVSMFPPCACVLQHCPHLPNSGFVSWLFRVWRREVLLARNFQVCLRLEWRWWWWWWEQRRVIGTWETSTSPTCLPNKTSSRLGNVCSSP